MVSLAPLSQSKGRTMKRPLTGSPFDKLRANGGMLKYVQGELGSPEPVEGS